MIKKNKEKNETKEKRKTKQRNDQVLVKKLIMKQMKIKMMQKKCWRMKYYKNYIFYLLLSFSVNFNYF